MFQSVSHLFPLCDVQAVLVCEVMVGLYRKITVNYLHASIKCYHDCANRAAQLQ